MKVILTLFSLLFLFYTNIAAQEQMIINKWEYSWSDVPVIENSNILVGVDWNHVDNAFHLFKVKNKKYLLIRMQIPEHGFTNPTLYIDVVSHQMIVFDTTEIYKYGDLESMKDFLPYSESHMILIPKNIQEKYLYFCIYSDLPKIGISGTVSLAEPITHYISMVKQDTDRLILGSLYMFVGVFQILLFLRRRKQTISLSFGLFSLSIGGYILCWLEIRSFYGIPPVLWPHFEYISLYNIPSTFCWFFIQMFGNGYQNIVSKCMKLHIVYFLCCLPFAILNPFFWLQTLTIFQILFLVTILSIIITSILAVASGNANAKIFIVGLLVLSVFGIYDTLGNMGLVAWSRSMGHWGMFTFMTCIAVILERRFHHTHLNLEKMNKACSRFIPWKFIELLGRKSIADVNLGDQIELKTTVLFSDIRSFTTISEKMTPQENFNFINSYLQRIVPVIRRHGGFVDKYIGDAIMAIFPGDPIYALNTAKEMIEKIKQYNIEQEKKGLFSIQIGIGIHTGSLMLGIIGETERMDCTVIADAVNTASRLEDLTKTYSVNIITSQETIDNLKDNIEHRLLGEVQVKGKNKPISIYEIIT